jgi:hypothetical protein
LHQIACCTVRAHQAAALRKQNAAMQERIRNTKAVTDNDITDDPAGAARKDASWWGK